MAFANSQDELERLKISGIEQQGSYVYKPTRRDSQQAQRQSKRRKVGGATEDRKQRPLFVPLLGGNEDESAMKVRDRAFQTFWLRQERSIQTILRDVHSEVLTNIVSFIEQTTSERCNGRVPTGIITLGSNITSIGRLFSRLQEQVRTGGDTPVVVLDSGDASNLKALLKTMIRGAITCLDGDEGFQRFTDDRVGPKLLPYDLDLLYEYAQKRGVEKVVIAFKDSEAFDQRLLSDLIALVSSWLDRIEFVLLFGVVTSVELFEGRLPRSAVNLLEGRLFEVRDSENSVDRIFSTLQNHEEGILWLGHGVSKMITQFSRDHFQSPERFSACVKYAHMAHFFANPLSVFLADNVPVKLLQQPQLCEAVRNLSSFRRYVDELLEEDETAAVRKLLDDDPYLAQEAKRHVKSGQEKVKSMFEAVEFIMTVLTILNHPKSTNSTDLSIQALQGELCGSKVVEDMLITTKKLPSDSCRDLLNALPETFAERDKLMRDLDSLLRKRKVSEPLRSQYDNRHTTHKTTVVGQRLKLTKGKTKLSQEDTEYTAFVDRLDTALAKHLSSTLIRPEDLFMHEAFLNDHRAPIKDTFTPRARFAIERGLSTPSDYLGSKSDDDDDSAGFLSASQPAVSILYQLYMESGALVNIYDLWRAFYTILGGEDGENCDERSALTIFYRALSELKMMGMIKSTRKKADHLAKSTWMGL